MIALDPLAHQVEHYPFKVVVPRSSRGWVTSIDSALQGRMAELVDAHALGACPARDGGSSPLPPINNDKCKISNAKLI